MKRNFIFSFIMFGVLFFGCNRSTKHNTGGKSEIYSIDIEQCYGTEKHMLISEIADTVEYIELKTPDDIIVTRIWDIKQIDDYLLIQARHNVYLFNKNGQFINMVGTRGEGPEDYYLPMAIEIDYQKRELIIVVIRKILFYDLGGNLLRTENKEDVYSFHTGISDSVLWVGYEIFYTSDIQKYSAVAVSLQDFGDTLAYIPNPIHRKMPDENTHKMHNMSPLTDMFYNEGGMLYFKGGDSSDSIWKISGAQAEPHAFINWGKYKMPVELEGWFSSGETFMQNMDRYWGASSLIEDSNHFFLFSHKRSFIKDKKKWDAEFMKYVVYNKEMKTGFSVKDNNDVGITDDILGGPSIMPRWNSDEYYIDAIEVFELLERMETGKYNPSAELKKQLSLMNEEDNAIIILCRRKK